MQDVCTVFGCFSLSYDTFVVIVAFVVASCFSGASCSRMNVLLLLCLSCSYFVVEMSCVLSQLKCLLHHTSYICE